MTPSLRGKKKKHLERQNRATIVLVILQDHFIHTAKYTYGDILYFVSINNTWQHNNVAMLNTWRTCNQQLTFKQQLYVNTPFTGVLTIVITLHVNAPRKTFHINIKIIS